MVTFARLVHTVSSTTQSRVPALRCVCENDLCGELVTRLNRKTERALASLPPKMLRLASAEPLKEIKPEAGVASLGISPLGVDSLLARWASRRSVSER